MTRVFSFFKDFVASWNKFAVNSQQQPIGGRGDHLESCVEAWFEFAARQCSDKRAIDNEASVTLLPLFLKLKVVSTLSEKSRKPQRRPRVGMKQALKNRVTVAQESPRNRLNLIA